ncbi:xenotropic and polytropic retrovirus receptor 1 homolog isoform X1 [Drosophila albomicans]|uniref:Xenotropic and polytropic retrovirus receptor 1 homolog isoform X1 n=1 Tax=Drosophila albomicans TaxID=7291 RepID=A0A9C6T2L2_DROAB|nr:xenotropic and polytropic retrovirus receptor 1 homolog isoform X1 [Drosophila albomicans]
MKFGKTFESHLTPEWREQYIHYAELKAMIYEALENAPRQKTLALEYYQKFSLEFFAVLKEELRRVNDFFEHKLAEARRKHATFKVKLMYLVRESGGMVSDIPTLPPLEDQPKTARHLERAYSEFYFSLVLLNNYQHLNVNGFHKICKKYDKYIHSTSGRLWLTTYVEPATISRERAIHTMLSEVENLFTHFVTNGNRTKAMAKLRVPPLGQPTSPIHIFSTGVVLGLLIVSLFICIVSYLFMLDRPEFLLSFKQMFRCSFLLMFYWFSVVINVYVWQSVGINHVLIFELNPRNQIQPIKMLALTSLFAYICTMSMIIFLHHNEFGIEDPLFIPIIGLCLPLVYLLNPLPIFNHPARMWILRTFGRIVAAPLFPVTFMDFWLCDQMNSMILCLVEYYLVTRFYFRYYKDGVSSPEPTSSLVVTVLRCLPPWWRLAQCMKRYWDGDPPTAYITNAFTYASTIVTVIIPFIYAKISSPDDNAMMNPLIWGYIISCIICSISCASWDLRMDFGLFRIWSGEHIFLREHLLYPKWFYYFAIVADIVIRFIWVIELNLMYFNLMTKFNCLSIISVSEIVRRFIWNFLRLENEHLYNCGHFRATRDIYISTLNSREDMVVEYLLDQSRDGRSAEYRQLDSSI